MFLNNLLSTKRGGETMSQKKWRDLEVIGGSAEGIGVFITIPDNLYGKVRAYAEKYNLFIQEAVLELIRKGLEAKG
jgi:hypothetical protein